MLQAASLKQWELYKSYTQLQTIPHNEYLLIQILEQTKKILTKFHLYHSYDIKIKKKTEGNIEWIQHNTSSFLLFLHVAMRKLRLHENNFPGFSHIDPVATSFSQGLNIISAVCVCARRTSEGKGQRRGEPAEDFLCLEIVTQCGEYKGRERLSWQDKVQSKIVSEVKTGVKLRRTKKAASKPTDPVWRWKFPNELLLIPVFFPFSLQPCHHVSYSKSFHFPGLFSTGERQVCVSQALKPKWNSLLCYISKDLVHYIIQFINPFLFYCTFTASYYL